PAAGPQQAAEHLQRRRLARAVRPDEAGDRSFGHLEAEPAQDVALPVAAGDVLEAEQRAHAPRYASSTRGSDRIAAGAPSASLLPWSSTIAGSQRRITSGMSCSTTRNVSPSACSRRM